ncbi:cilia- and flagella-associated protein 77 isoform X2 [Sebastes fasciatus]|uniref:cilia- and flagella-associated protein 77 isoform X2 n=1 Tax=Sebastes fasciatus TaxID=394691 RepID=UPI003D9F1DCE
MTTEQLNTDWRTPETADEFIICDHQLNYLLSAVSLRHQSSSPVFVTSLRPQSTSSVYVLSLRPQSSSPVFVFSLRPQSTSSVFVPSLRHQSSSSVFVPSLRPQSSSSVFVLSLRPQSSSPVFVTSLRHQSSSPVYVLSLRPQSSSSVFVPSLRHQSSSPVYVLSLRPQSSSPVFVTSLRPQSSSPVYVLSLRPQSSSPVFVLSPREDMSSPPRVGVVRTSMLTNQLLIKASLGKTRSRGMPVPGPDFTYGTSSSQLRDGGVSEGVSSWRVPSSRPRPPVAPDFVSLNRDAVKSGLVTSKELNQYRAQRGGTRIQRPAPNRREDGDSRHPAVADITYGVTTRPSSPLSDLLSHQYARRWTELHLNRKRTNQQLQRVKAEGVPDTRSSLLRRSRPLPVTQTPFTLRRFTQAAPALDTFRDQESRLGAFRAHQRGVQGLD